MDIIHQAKKSRGVIYLNTMVMTNIAASGDGAVAGLNSPWSAASWSNEYEAITSSRPLIKSDSNKVLSNAGAATPITLDLPLAASSSGVMYNLVRVATEGIIIDPNVADRIIYSSGIMSLGEFLRMDSDGAKITLVSDGVINWIATNELGVLAQETP